jgi:type I restriction enzyme S subunit
MSDELPQGWATAPVSAVIEDLQAGFASGEKSVAGGVAHLRMNNIGLEGELVLDLIRTVPERLAKLRHDLRQGDVLVCTTNSGKLVGKTAYFDLPGRYTFSNHLTRLRPKRDVIDGRFLRWNLWLHWKRGLFDDKCKHWVNQSNLPKAALMEDTLVVPPLAEQRRIVAKLEVLLGKVSACQKRLATIPVLLERFRQSVLGAACSGRLTADWRANRTVSEDVEGFVDLMSKERLGFCRTPRERTRITQFFSQIKSRDDLNRNGWVRLKAELVCDFITKGSTPGEVESETKEKVPFLKVYNIVENRINFRYRPQFVSRQSHEGVLRRSAVLPGDVLMNIVGPPLGKVAIVPSDYPEWNINQALAIFRPVACVKAEFLVISLLGSGSLRAIINETRGIVGQSNISLEQCRHLEVAVPGRAEQKEIVHRVEALFALADQLEARLARVRAQVDKLTPSLLARAFRGRLVPTGGD